MKSIENEGPATGTATSLYLVRVWRKKSSDGVTSLHGKLQHVVSGASCYFDGLSGLPEALGKMLEQDAGSTGPNANSGRRADNGSTLPDTR